jgi:hypothetical protein
MVDYCENVLKAIRSAPTEKTLDGLVRDSITGFMRMRNGQLGSNYIMNMIAFLHSAADNATADELKNISHAIELFKWHQLRDPDKLLHHNKMI